MPWWIHDLRGVLDLAGEARALAQSGEQDADEQRDNRDNHQQTRSV